jgi:hypothetical protein
MAKKRVGVLLRESIGGAKSSNKSSDLAALTQRYVEFTKRIRAMVDALKAQHACMIQMEESRLKVRIYTLACIHGLVIYELSTTLLHV